MVSLRWPRRRPDVQPPLLSLALQGGGAHGAYTWGVLDRLLEAGIRIDGISGTSAGAMNAAALAAGHAQGGRQGARRALDKFWHSTAQQALLSPMRRTPLDRLLGRWNLDASPGYHWLSLLGRVFSPYQFNPANLNPLRGILDTQVDFERLREESPFRLFVSATNVRTSHVRVFATQEMSVDVLLASSCLPTVFQTVTIDGEGYWDGGYLADPPLFPFFYECRSRDLLVIMVNPLARERIPRNPGEILDRLNEITFNASLVKELRAILLLRDRIEAEGLEDERWRDMRLHRIHGDEDLVALEPSSKLNAEWAYLCHLRDLGRTRTDHWLRRHGADIGVRSTFDLSWLLEDSLKPVGAAPPPDGEAQGTGRGRADGGAGGTRGRGGTGRTGGTGA